MIPRNHQESILPAVVLPAAPLAPAAMVTASQPDHGAGEEEEPCGSFDCKRYALLKSVEPVEGVFYKEPQYSVHENFP